MMRPDLDRFIAGWRGPVMAALVALLAGLPVLMLLPPLDRDESRYAQATSQMLEDRDFVDIRFQDDPRWKKPVGIYWMQAAAVAATSSVENRDIQPYRIPSILGAMLAAAAAAWAGAAMFGQRAGFLAGAMLGATFLLSTEAGIAKTDAMLCASVTLAMAGLARIYLATRAGAAPRRLHKLVFWAGVGLSILIKGPIGLIVVVPAIVALSLWDRDVKWLARLGWGWGLPLVALIVGPWAIAITIATDGGFWREAVMGDLAPKIAGGHESHGAPPGYYLLGALLMFFPLTLMLPAALSTGWSRRAEPAVRFLVCWLVPAWLIFELTPTKLAHYTLPTYGALALLAAAALTRPIGPVSRYAGAALSLAGGLIIVLITVYGLTEFGRSTAQGWATLTIVFAALAALIGAFLLLHRAATAAVVVAIGLGILAHAGLAGTIRQLKPLAIAPQLQTVLERADLHPRQGRPGPVAITGFHEPSFVFLTGRATELTDAAGAARALAEGRPVIVEAREADAFSAASADLGVTGRAVGVVDGHNYSRGDDVSLTVYAPSGAPVGDHAVSRPITIVEVGPRDGLQNEKAILEPAVRAELTRRLEAAGARRIEAVSFVHPKYVPQMAGAEEVMAALPHEAGRSRIGLVLNGKGYDRALGTSVDEVNVAMSATDGFGLKNQGMGVDQQVSMLSDILTGRANAEGEPGATPSLSATLSCVWGCPFDGEVSAEQVADVVGRIGELGVREIALADTIGVGNPWAVTRVVEAARKAAPEALLRLHFHDTRNTGLANAYAGVEAGVDVLDASVGGIGGCPFAPGATGNIATEDLVYMLERAGFSTGYDLDALIETARWIGEKIGRPAPSALSRAGAGRGSRMADLHIGAEWDRAAQRRLKVALRKAGARRVGSFWGVFGSQEISNATFAIGSGRVQVDAETYGGVTVSGDDDAIEILRRHL